MITIDANLVQDLIAELQQKRWTMALAESCTAGQVSTHLGSVAGVSAVYRGGLVCYAEDVKQALLQVPVSVLQQSGAVSEACARAMARGAKKLLLADWALAVTGFAGPSGGSAQEPIGSVWFAVSGPQFEEAIHCRFSGDRWQIQSHATQEALQFLLRSVISQSP